jgi:hydrogenase-4 component H
MSTDWDTAGFGPGDFEETVTRELLLCEVCGGLLAPAAQLHWLAERLGPMAFANPTLALFAGQSLGYVEPGVRSTDDHALRQDRLAMQCPKCRRESAWAA